MQKIPINLTNSIDVEEYLKKFCGGDVRLQIFLIAAMANIIKKSPDCMEELTSLPDDAPSWLRQKWNQQPHWHKFAPRKNIRLAGEVHQTILWVEDAIFYEADWLQNVDEAGRPKKLLKLSSFKQLQEEREIDKRKLLAKARALGRDDLKDEVVNKDIILVMEFEEGSRIVKLLTERALDRESAFLEHCIGDGYYDSYVRDQALFVYSLRSKDNTPHVTFSVDYKRGTVSYIAGKRNNYPDVKYMPYIHTFCAEYCLCIEPFKPFEEGYSRPLRSDLDLYFVGLDDFLD